jgi:hypothetical protein
MKQCPTCNRIFADDTLVYCLADGSFLTSSYDSEATQQMTPPRPTNPPPPTVLSTPPPVFATPPPAPTQPTPTRQGVNPTVVYVLIAVLALIVGGGVVALLRPGAKVETPSSPATVATKQEPAATASNEPETKKPVRPETSTQSSPAPAPPAEAPRQRAAPSGYPEASSSRYLSESDLASKSCFELKIMRNEIFARHGYIFKTDDMRAYFSRQSWYRPLYDDVSGQLSGVERKNAQLIKQYENGKGCS